MGHDEEFMALAIREAERAAARGDTPFGAVLVRDDKVIAAGHNQETDFDPTAHAELLAIRQACESLHCLKLTDCTLFTTCEPCLTCSGAVFAAKIPLVVIGVLWRDVPERFHVDRKHSLLSLIDRAGYSIAYRAGVLRDQCLRLYRP